MVQPEGNFMTRGAGCQYTCQPAGTLGEFHGYEQSALLDLASSPLSYSARETEKKERGRVVVEG